MLYVFSNRDALFTIGANEQGLLAVAAIELLPLGTKAD